MPAKKAFRIKMSAEDKESLRKATIAGTIISIIVFGAYFMGWI